MTSRPKNHAFTDLADGTYALTAYVAGYVFTPARQQSTASPARPERAGRRLGRRSPFRPRYPVAVAKTPSTPATRLLREKGVAYAEHTYRDEEHGGTAVSARELGVDEHAVVKTLIMEDQDGEPLVVLMHGDREVSVKALARQLSRKSIQICRPEVANRHSGYLVGGTSPFGTRKAMPVCLERSILELPRIYLNGGSRGFLVGLAPSEVVRILSPTLVDVAIAP